MTDTGDMSVSDPRHVSEESGRDSSSGHASMHSHAADGDALGPVDVIAWAYALAGGALGLIVAMALYAAIAG